jgi:hypothetical protein
VLAKPETRRDTVASMGEDFGNSLAGTDAAALVAEGERHAKDWDLVDYAPRLAGKPLLVVDAKYGLADQAAPLNAAIKAQKGARLQALTLPSDHAFADQRIALAGAVVDWLDRLGAR